MVRNFPDIRVFFFSPFLADSGCEEQDDGLLGWMKASATYLSHGNYKLRFLQNRLQKLDLHDDFAAYNVSRPDKTAFPVKAMTDSHLLRDR